MPPHFKSAQQKRPSSPSDHDSNQEQNEQHKKRNASYLENLYPEKFGGQKQHHNNRNHNNNNNNNGKNRLPPSAAPSWCHIPGTKDENGTPVIIPRVGVPVPLPPRSGPTRRERSASTGNKKQHQQQQQQQSSSSPNGVRHITFDRQVIRKINPTITIPEREKPNFWFQEGMEESVESEYVTMNIGSVNMLELPGPSNLLLVGWENEETGAETGRVTLYMSQLPPGMQRPDPTKMVAVCTLNPFQNAIPMKIVLPAGPYMFEARYCNKKLMPKQQNSSDSEGAPKVLLLLETRGESFCLK